MNLFTRTGKKVKTTKLKTPVDLQKGIPHSLSINDVAMTSFTTATKGKTGPYYFMWGGEWYSLSKKAAQSIKKEEQMIFFTKAPLLKKKSEYSTFIVITQFPNIKGAFVGTVLRAFIDDARNAICFIKDKEVVISRDNYRYAYAVEIYSYFSQHFNKFVFITDTIDAVKKVENIITDATGALFVCLDDKKEVALTYVHDVTDEQLLSYYREEAAKRQFTLGALVAYDFVSYTLQAFKLSPKKQLDVELTTDNGRTITVPIEDITLLQSKPPVNNGTDLANYFIKIIEESTPFPIVNRDVAESFFNTMKNWSVKKLECG